MSMRKVAAVALLFALAGCAPPSTGPAQPAAPAAPAAPAPVGAPAPAGPILGFTGDLRTLLLPRPSGATNAADPKSDGTITIEQAAASFGDANQGMTQLRALGFQRG